MIIHKPIFIVEDDEDDRELIWEIFKRLNYPNKLMFFNNGAEAFEYLMHSVITPFLILSDVNMPKLNGFELKKKMNEVSVLESKRIPFVYFSTAGNSDMVRRAFALNTQGYFFKVSCVQEMEKTISVIMDYWKLSAVPAYTEC